jgi:hypothetical protein
MPDTSAISDADAGADATAAVPVPLHVRLRREPFSDYVELLVLATGASEELEAEDVREWFRLRGANMDTIETVLDELWNLERELTVVIEKPREITTRGRVTPDV